MMPDQPVLHLAPHEVPKGSYDANWAQGFAGHLSTANYLFADGHVKSLRPTATASPLNMWGATNNTAPTGCTAGSINCDTPDPSVSSGMAVLFNKYK